MDEQVEFTNKLSTDVIKPLVPKIEKVAKTLYSLKEMPGLNGSMLVRMTSLVTRLINCLTFTLDQ